MSLEPRDGWRAFPWDPSAKPGAPFSAGFTPPWQGHGRFDLPGESAGVLYLAELPEHALAELLQDLRNRDLDDDDLFEAGQRIALSSARLPAQVFENMADLCDPDTIGRLAIPPDHVAALSRDTTQAISTRLHAEGRAGFRWWSAFFGEWHTLVVFRDRIDSDPQWSEPVPIHTAHETLAETARYLGIRIIGA